MDKRLVAWGRAVKARRGTALPPLWLFTDPARMPDLLASLRRLPPGRRGLGLVGPGLVGIVFRHDGVADRAALLRRVARLCRERRLLLVVAGRGPVPPGAGRHLRGGRGRRDRAAFLTSSAHDRIELVRARRAGASLAFLSPAFPTTSHPDAEGWGAVRWAALARAAKMDVAALGGVHGGSAKRLPRWAAGAGAIDALR